MDKNELQVLALTQRIGEITSAYEARIAELRAEITILAEQGDSKESDEPQD